MQLKLHAQAHPCLHCQSSAGISWGALMYLCVHVCAYRQVHTRSSAEFCPLKTVLLYDALKTVVNSPNCLRPIILSRANQSHRVFVNVR